mgnify:CR=1 FL=1
MLANDGKQHMPHCVVDLLKILHQICQVRENNSMYTTKQFPTGQNSRMNNVSNIDIQIVWPIANFANFVNFYDSNNKQ